MVYFGIMFTSVLHGLLFAVIVVGIPVDADKTVFLVVMQIKRALAGAMQRLPEAFGQADVRGGDDQRIRAFFDADDAMERMPGPLAPLVLAGQIEQFLFVRLDEISAHRDEPGRIIVPDPPAGLAYFPGRIHRPGCQPLPAPVLEDRAANWTNA
jgi:hypothetical protein